MVCSDLAEVTTMIPKSEVVDEKRDDFVEGIIEGLKDFAEGRYTVFKDDDELEAHLMSL
jgi:Mg2+/Co2+ transporter CorC